MEFFWFVWNVLRLIIVGKPYNVVSLFSGGTFISCLYQRKDGNGLAAELDTLAEFQIWIQILKNRSDW